MVIRFIVLPLQRQTENVLDMQEKLDVKIILLDNNFLGMVRQWQELFFHKRYSSTQMDNPNFVAIAKAYGIASREVRRREDLNEAIKEMLEHV